MKLGYALFLSPLLLLACKTKPVGEEAGVKIDLTAPTASAPAAPDAAVGLSDDDEEPGTEGDGGCPLPVHPDYCRRNCRTFTSRTSTHHASRIRSPNAFALGSCGPYKVFAENDSTAGDAGIIEYFDDAGALVAAEDRRAKGCGRFGTIPSCTPDLHWAPPAMIKLGTFTVSSGLTPEVVQRIVRTSSGRYRNCYEDALAKDPTLKGKLVLSFEVGKDGLVSGARKGTGSDLANEGVVQCATKLTNGMTFPIPDGGVKVSVTFSIDFAPKG
jgi:hypothetical protein